jgi:hypothetical protein
MAVLCVIGVAACSAAAPTPRPVPSARGTAPTASGTLPSPSAEVSPRPREGLGAEIEIASLDPALTHPVLEFASDGSSVLYSSGIAPDTGPDGAPDLWSYEPGVTDVPELLWRNPERNNSLVKIAGDLGTIAFVDIPLTGERAWNLWLIPEAGADAILLDMHPGDEDVSSLVPSFDIYQPMIAWTAFDRGPAGPVSQLLVAEAPSWEPRVLLERPAEEAELWLPSLYGRTLVYTEVTYSDDRTSDERSVHLLEVLPGQIKTRRLDTSGRATMPVIVDEVVFWKEADPGFNMFNWGRMFRYDLRTDEVDPASVWPQEYVNYPSAGSRFIAWWGADSYVFGVYDVERARARQIELYTAANDGNVLRPSIAGDLLVWMFVDPLSPDLRSELRYAFLPSAGADRLEGG